MRVHEAIQPKVFWDVNPANLHWKKDSQFIIERVLARGQTSDVRAVFNQYAPEEIKTAVLKSKTLTPKVANYISLVYKIPLKDIHVAPEYY